MVSCSLLNVVNKIIIYRPNKKVGDLAAFTVQRQARSRHFYAGETCAFRGMTDAGRRLAASTRSSGHRAREDSRVDWADAAWWRDGGGMRLSWRGRTHRLPAGRLRAGADVVPASRSPTESHRMTTRLTWSTSHPVDFSSITTNTIDHRNTE